MLLRLGFSAPVGTPGSLAEELSITMLSVKAEEKEEKAAKPMDLDIKNDSDFGATSAGATSAGATSAE